MMENQLKQVRARVMEVLLCHMHSILPRKVGLTRNTISKQIRGRSNEHILYMQYQPHGRSGPETQKDRLPAQLAGRWGHSPGQRHWNSVRWGKKYFELGRREQPRQGKNVLYQHDKPNESTKEGPFTCTLEIPIYLSFNSQQGLPLSSLSGRAIQITSLSMTLDDTTKHHQGNFKKSESPLARELGSKVSNFWCMCLSNHYVKYTVLSRFIN